MSTHVWYACESRVQSLLDCKLCTAFNNVESKLAAVFSSCIPVHGILMLGV